MTAIAHLSDHDVFDLYPEEFIDHDNIDHYRAMAGRRLVIRKCQDCGYWIYPHRPLCPECLSWNVRFEEVVGKGRVFMETRLHQLRDPNSNIVEPVVAAAVELAERDGLRYLSRIVNCPLEDIRLDMPVTLTWIEDDGQVWPAFEPARV